MGEYQKLLRSLKIIDPLPAPALPFPLPPKPISPAQVNLIQKVVYLPLPLSLTMQEQGSPTISLQKSESEKSLTRIMDGGEEAEKGDKRLTGWRKIFGRYPTGKEREGEDISSSSHQAYLPTLSAHPTSSKPTEKLPLQNITRTTSAKRYRPDFADKRYHFPPPVRLPSELASCTVCLMDFVEGRERSPQGGEERGEEGEGEGDVLRLLECGHAFHVSLKAYFWASASGTDSDSLVNI